MSLESYFFNISTRKFVRGSTSAQSIPPPVWGHNDVRDFGVTFVKSTGLARVQVVTDAVAARVNVASPTDPNTQLATATASTSVNNEHPFLLTLVSAGLTTFMTSVVDPKLARGLFILTTTQGEARYPFDLYIEPKGVTAGQPDTSTTDTFLTSNQTAALYVPKVLPSGSFLTWPDEDTGIVYYIRLKGGKLEINDQ